jgi:DNA-directed RNA polymerase subunit L
MNSYDIILKNEDYTIGKIIEYILYTKFYENTQILTFCGFKKMHPHDTDSIIRIAYKEVTDKTTIKQNLKSCIDDAIAIYKKIKKDM